MSYESVLHFPSLDPISESMDESYDLEGISQLEVWYIDKLLAILPILSGILRMALSLPLSFVKVFTNIEDIRASASCYIRLPVIGMTEGNPRWARPDSACITLLLGISSFVTSELSMTFMYDVSNSRS